MVIGEQPLFHRKLNKKGKPAGKAVLSGFTLDFGVPLNSAAASNAANYQVDTVTTKKVKKVVEHILHPITKFTGLVYSGERRGRRSRLRAKETFPTGGQITILGGVTDRLGRHVGRSTRCSRSPRAERASRQRECCDPAESVHLLA